MRTSIALATSEFLPLIEIAQAAERGGYHRLWTTESPTRDAPVRALTIAMRTSTIEVATGISYAFTRSPLAMAAMAADINEASGGRFSLGLGAGTRGIRRHWYGVDDFDAPATRLAEYAALMRAAWKADRDFEFSGRYYRGRYNQMEGPRDPLPIWGSGLNPTMLTVGARHFDGVAVHALATAPGYLDSVALPAIDKGRSDSSRPVELAAWRLVAVSDDGDTARAKARAALAFYFSTPSYVTVADATGWSDVAGAIRQALTDSGPRWPEIGRLIPLAMLEQFCSAGRPAEVRAGWETVTAQLEERGFDEVVVQTTSTDGTGPENVRAIADLVATLSPR